MLIGGRADLRDAVPPSNPAPHPERVDRERGGEGGERLSREWRCAPIGAASVLLEEQLLERGLRGLLHRFLEPNVLQLEGIRWKSGRERAPTPPRGSNPTLLGFERKKCSIKDEDLGFTFSEKGRSHEGGDQSEKKETLHEIDYLVHKAIRRRSRGATECGTFEACAASFLAARSRAA